MIVLAPGRVGNVCCVKGFMDCSQATTYLQLFYYHTNKNFEFAKQISFMMSFLDKNKTL